MKADMKARVSNLTKTEAEWSKLNFKPYPGELIVYAPDKNDDSKCVRVKIGDGQHTLQELPFVIEHTAAVLLSEYNRMEELDAGRIAEYF